LFSSSFTNALLLTTNAMKPFYKHVLHENLPIESHLDQSLHDHFNSEINSRVISSKQDAVDYLTWTFLYRRLPLNPHYYNLASASHRHISDHLSELVESTLESLSETKCIQIIDELYVEPLNLGMIAAYYSIHYGTIEMMASSLQANTRLRGILQVISAAAEFDWLVEIRVGEESQLSALHARCPVRLGAASLKFHDPHVKVAILLQCHFSRIELPLELQGDLDIILNRIVALNYALIDVLSSQGWLAPALAAMEFCQMCVQGLWDSDSSLRQLPHFSVERIKLAAEVSCESISEFVELEDSAKLSILKGLPSRAIAEIAGFANNYPSDLEVALVDGAEISCKSGQDISLSVSLTLEREDSDFTVKFKPSRFPCVKEMAWWVLVGNPVDRTILAIKRVNLPSNSSSRQVELDFAAPEVSHETSMSLKVYVLCDSFMGCDQELDFSIFIEI
jgi:pre-mRNA-splicing helicase BRR2